MGQASRGERGCSLPCQGVTCLCSGGSTAFQRCQGLRRGWLLGGNLGEGAATDRREVILIGVIPRLHRAVMMLNEQPALLFAKATGPNERKRLAPACAPRGGISAFRQPAKARMSASASARSCTASNTPLPISR